MDTELIEANPLVEETIGQIAVKRGPIVYCLESVDLPKGTKPLDILIAPESNLRARYDQRLLGGIAVLEGTAVARMNSDWEGQLYRNVQPSRPTPVKLRLIPYSVWANRGPAEMSVWLRAANQ
ncbi:MAG TPA: glycoside hydrolase family 127 protein, partial [Verrucomicrobiae bacterium]|nr:glycoside hydrolase family 127 protein [Verrucomicrobiae bacterium]